MSKNLHLVPQAVLDVASKLNPSIKINDNEKWMAIQRMEAIRDYCVAVLKVAENK